MTIHVPTGAVVPSEIGPGERRVLASIGLVDPDLSSPLIQGLVLSIRRVGPGKSDGSYLAAMRFHIVQELLEAGRVYATAKAGYERAVARRTVEEMARPRDDGRKMSLGWAEAIATDASGDLKLDYLVAEKREQAMRKWLDAIEGALDVYRTHRADERAADTAHARGLTGGA